MLTVSPFLAWAGLFAALLCLLITSLIHWRRRTETRLQVKRVTKLRQKIESALDDEDFDAQRAAFGKALQSASLTTELQRPRLENLAKIDKQAPEKYRILSKLASQGLNVEEIAAILGVSSVEANQLLNLSSVAQMRQGL
jgi:DNA-directed RNA polymerase specialized sigma24 family protein